jgi:murein DD-endopeptidase MepM/ murein hydrolase activator NlpD
MDAKQIGLQDYNDAILSVYGANPIVQMNAPSDDEDAGSETQELTADAPSKKERRIKKGTLFTETLKLKKAALLNLSLAKRIFEYEQDRLKQLTSDLLDLEPKKRKAEESSKKEKQEKEEEQQSEGFLKDLFESLFGNLRRRISIKFRRSIGRKNRLRIKKFRRFIRTTKVGLKRFRRNLTRPFRQVTRFAKSIPKKAWKGIKGIASTANQIRKFVGGSIQMAKGPKPAAAPKPSGFKLPSLPKGVKLPKMPVGPKGGIFSALFAGFEFSGRKSEGQSNVEAGVGTAGSVAGGLAGAAAGGKAGAVAGAAIGAMFGGVGAAPGALIGGILGSLIGGTGGAFAGGKVADVATGADQKYAEGGKVTGPQLAFIGEGGEPEYVVPESKLAYFLSGSTGIGLINAGAKPIFSGIRKLVESIGLDSKIISSIPEFNLERQLPETDVKVPVAPDIKGTPKFNLGRSIIDQIVEGFKNLIKDLPNLLPAPLKALLNGVNGLVQGANNLFNGDAPEVSASPYLTRGGVNPDAYVYSRFRTSNRPGHNGVDYSGGPFSKIGTPISVIMPGVVHHVGDHGNTSWGKHVVVKHNNGRFTLYGHLNSINVSVGQKLEPDAAGNAPVIGTLGNTGRSEGPHLHFEMGSGWNGVIKNHINPEPHAKDYFRGGGTKVTPKPDPKTTDAPKVSGSGNLLGNLNPPSNPLALPSPMGLNMMGNAILPTPESNLGLMNGMTTIVPTTQYVPVPVPIPTSSGGTRMNSIYSTWGTTPNRK